MRNTAVAYAIALGAVAAAVLFHFAFGNLLANTLPLVTLLGAVALSVWMGGYRLALAATVAGLLACVGIFTWPHPANQLLLGHSLLDIAAYLVASLLIIAFGEHLHRVGRRMESKNREIDLALKRAEESERRFRRLADTAPVLIWVSGADRLSTWFNKQWLDFVGRPMERELGNGWTENVHPDDLDRCVQAYAGAFDAREPFSMEFRLKRHDGQYRWILDNGIPLYGPHNEFTGFVGSCIDIGDHKRLEQSLKETDRRKDEFLATLSHELRNPLAAIRNSVEIMKRSDRTGGDLHKGGEIIERQLKHVSRLLEDLLDLSRISHNKIVLRKERVEIGAIVQDAVERSRALIDDGVHEINVSSSPASLFVDADPIRLSQVFCNLVDNAAKYSGPQAPIEIRWEQQGGEVVVCVRDHGIGIKPEMLDRIFEMFYQLAPAQGRSQGGLGIGLSLARYIVQLHGGTLLAKSEGLENGSEFMLRLPLVPNAAGRRSEARQVDDSAASGQNTRHRVLVVDDSEDSADSLAMILSLSGHEVRAVYDGESAIEAARSFRPTVILMDVGMPGVNGIDACRRIQSERWGKDIHIVALTGWGQDADRQRTAEAGFHDHLVKPVDPAALIKLVSQYPEKN